MFILFRGSNHGSSKLEVNTLPTEPLKDAYIHISTTITPTLHTQVESLGIFPSLCWMNLGNNVSSYIADVNLVVFLGILKPKD